MDSCQGRGDGIMSDKLKNNGFSLTEVLLAVGTLAIGLMFIGGTFLAGIYFATIATERTIGAVAAGEAFAKVKLYRVNLSQVKDSNCVDFNEVSLVTVKPGEFSYPSTRTRLAEKQYFWSALCRWSDQSQQLVQVTVFVSRKAGSNTEYRNPLDPFDPEKAVYYPKPVLISVSGAVGDYVLTIQEAENWINDGCTIVEDTTGQIYQVIERYAEQPDTVRLNKRWDLDGIYPDPALVWVVPPPFGSGKSPCIAVYQRIIGFEW